MLAKISLGHNPFCCFGGCRNAAVYKVGARLWARGHDRSSHPPAEMFTTLTVCEAHKGHPKLEHFFTPQGQAQIAKAFKAAKKAIPEFKSAELIISPIKEGA